MNRFEASEPLEARTADRNKTLRNSQAHLMDDREDFAFAALRPFSILLCMDFRGYAAPVLKQIPLRQDQLRRHTGAEPQSSMSALDDGTVECG
jgi:hypothetical protein